MYKFITQIPYFLAKFITFAQYKSVKTKQEMKDFKPTAYTLCCVASERKFEDTGWVLEDKECEAPSLVRAIYDKKELELKGDEWGFYTFCDWLPVKRLLKGSDRKSIRLNSSHIL